MTTNSFAAMDTIDVLHHEYVAKMQRAAPSSNLSTLIEFQPVTRTMVNNSVRRGGNVLGLERVTATYGQTLMWLVSLTVDTEEHQKAILPIAHDFVDAINKRQRQQGIWVDWIYLNYAWKDENPYKYYRFANTALLKDASAKYDPNRIFQDLRRTGFKLA